MVKDRADEPFEIDPILKIEIMETQACPECGSTRLMRDYESVEIVCMDCGFVVNQKKVVNKGTKLRTFNEKQTTKRARSNASLTYTIHDKDLTTVIDWHNRGNRYYENVPVDQKTQVYRLRKWQRRIRVTSSTEHNLAYALSEMTKISSKMRLPKNVLETASGIYQKVVKEHLISGRSIQGIATATLYLACRQCGLSKTLDDFVHASSVSKKELGRNYRFLVKKFDYSILPLQPDQCIIKFSDNGTIQEKVEEVTHKILIAAKESKLTAGRSNPASIAAAAGYIALVLMGEHKTQKEIADIVQTTEMTIKNRYKELVNQLMFEISL